MNVTFVVKYIGTNLLWGLMTMTRCKKKKTTTRSISITDGKDGESRKRKVKNIIRCNMQQEYHEKHILQDRKIKHSGWGFGNKTVDWYARYQKN